MKRTAMMVGLVMLVIGIVWAGEYTVDIGNVKKARIKQILLTFDDDENVVRADCYWRLTGQSGQVLLERAPSTCLSTNTDGWQGVKDFVKNELSDHRQAMKVQFKEDN